MLVWQSHYTCHLLNAIHCHVWIWEGNLICSMSCWELTEEGRGHPLLSVSFLQSPSKWALMGTPEPWHILLLLFFNLHWSSSCVPLPSSETSWMLCPLPTEGLRAWQRWDPWKIKLTRASWRVKHRVLHFKKVKQILSYFAIFANVKETQLIPYNLMATFCMARWRWCCWIPCPRGQKQGCDTPWGVGPGTDVPCHLHQKF